MVYLVHDPYDPVGAFSTPIRPFLGYLPPILHIKWSKQKIPGKGSPNSYLFQFLCLTNWSPKIWIFFSFSKSNFCVFVLFAVFKSQKFLCGYLFFTFTLQLLNLKCLCLWIFASLHFQMSVSLFSVTLCKICNFQESKFSLLASLSSLLCYL